MRDQRGRGPGLEAIEPRRSWRDRPMGGETACRFTETRDTQDCREGQSGRVSAGMDEAVRNPAADREAPQAPNSQPGAAAGSVAAEQLPRLPFPPVVMAIAGCSGSGKTTLANELARTLGGLRFHLDDYYLDLGNLPLAERVQKNFDDPALIEVSLLARDVAALGARRKHRSADLRLCNVHAGSGAEPARDCRSVSHCGGNLRAPLPRITAQLPSARVCGCARRALF